MANQPAPLWLARDSRKRRAKCIIFEMRAPLRRQGAGFPSGSEVSAPSDACSVRCAAAQAALSKSHSHARAFPSIAPFWKGGFAGVPISQVWAEFPERVV